MDLNKQLERAREATNRGNDEYAIELYQDLLALAPDNLQARKELLETTIRKYRKLGVASAGKGAAFTKGLGAFLKANVYSAIGKHEQAMIECEKYLALEPSDRNVRKILAKSARAAGHTNTAIWVYEWLADTNKKDAMVLRSLGELYREKGDIDTSMVWYERYKKAKPTDRAIDALLRDLDAQRTMTKSGWDKAGEKGDFKRYIRDEEDAQDLIDETRLIRTLEDWQRAVNRIKRGLEETPDSKRLMLQLADTYRSGDEYESYKVVFPLAKEWYNKARELDSADITIVERLEDLQIAEYDHEIEDLEGDESKKEQLEELKKARAEYSMKVYVNRVKNRPTDTNLRYSLAELYFRYDEIDLAMQQYQHAVRDPKLRRQSLNRLGRCLMIKGIYDMAIARFEDAVKGVIVIGPEEKDILYNLGNAAEASGDTEKAEDVYKRIYEVDISFRDVAQKIEDIYKKRRQKT